MKTSPNETLLLSLLAQKPQGAYGSELMRMSDGKVKRGSVYTLLARLEAAGYVASKEEPPTDRLAVPRTVYRITAAGRAVRRETAEWLGFAVPAMGGSLT